MVEYELMGYAKSVATISNTEPGYEIAEIDRVKFESSLTTTKGDVVYTKTIEQFDIDGPQIPQEVQKGFIGHKVDDIFRVETTIPANYRNPDFANQDAFYEFKILEITKITIPPLDDELAKDLNIPGINTLDDLKKLIRLQLVNQYEQIALDNMEYQLNCKLVDSISIQLPDVLIESGIDKVIMQKRESIKQKYNVEFKDKPEDWLKNEKLRADNRAQGIFNATIGVIYAKIVAENNLNVSNEEIIEAIKHDYADYSDKPIFDDLNTSKLASIYKNSLLNNKVRDLIISKCQVSVVEQGTEPLTSYTEESTVVPESVYMVKAPTMTEPTAAQSAEDNSSADPESGPTE
jgi:FKBP-type peptidyl-prolyl cis-trans isomerase (trigger factor)